jgi:hypothetical protein
MEALLPETLFLFLILIWKDWISDLLGCNLSGTRQALAQKDAEIIFLPLWGVISFLPKPVLSKTRFMWYPQLMT